MGKKNKKEEKQTAETPHSVTMASSMQRFFHWKCLDGHDTEETYESLYYVLKQMEKAIECDCCKMQIPLHALLKITIGQQDPTLARDARKMAGTAMYNGPLLKDADHEGIFPKFKEGKDVSEIIVRGMIEAGMKNWKQIEAHMIERHGKEHRPKRSLTGLLVVSMAVKMQKDFSWLKIAVLTNSWAAIWYAQMNHDLNFLPRFVSMEGLDGKK